MRTPIRLRAISENERQQLEAGLRTQEAFVLRRCQILLAANRGQYAPAIAQAVGCDDETVRDVIRAFNERGLKCLGRQSSRPHTIHTAFSDATLLRLKDLLHESPRKYGKNTSVWTLELAGEVSLEQGLTSERVSGETIRTVLKRLGIGWQRAKHWITSPDPAYARKKTRVIG
jgi:transposase